MVDLENIQKYLAQFNQEYLFGDYQETILVKKELQKSLSFYDTVARKVADVSQDLPYNKMDFQSKRKYTNCLRKLKEVDEVVDDCLKNATSLWKINI